MEPNIIILRTPPYQTKDFRKDIFKVNKACFRYNEYRFTEESFAKTLAEKETTFHLAMDKNKHKIIGYMITSEFRLPNRSKYLYLYQIAVHPKYRNLRIGRQLFDLFITEGKRLKINIFRLHAINPAVVSMCDSKGFKKIKFFKQYIGKNNCTLFELRLK